jgi:hypothetical protein
VSQIRAPGRVGLRRVVREGIAAWRRDFRYISLLALIVETPVVLIQLAAALITNELPNTDEGFSVSLLSVAFALSSMLAHYFLAAVIEVIEGAERRGRPPPGLIDLARELPWKRLIVADTLLRVATLVGFTLLIVPGVIIATFTIIVLPLLNMERQPVIPTIRRSVDLVRDHVPTALGVLFVVTVVGLFVQELMGELFQWLTDSHLVEFIAHLVTEVIVLPMAALPVVMLAFDLVDDRAGRTRQTSH